jgi:hypothetical protein
MSGGWRSQAKKRGVVRAGARLAFFGRLPGPRFLPKGLGLDGLGVADPNLLKCSQPKAVTTGENGRMGGSAAETIH